MKIEKCCKCMREFEMPDSFIGSILCENCDPFMNPPQTSHNSGYMVRKAKALLSQIAKTTSYIRKRCVQ